ncbi:ATP-dependent Clp protease ATP-binding subunit [Marseilla massiliensis]|jgi:ATP-dependent Clp protease ATP-binding subunit ClpC|uniref:ATP-dependent Clp protease ATP-binding subunit n=1 Tax=Marseilla massiliensis TaxID=1841864 RepID=A0A938WRX1_9BACT|nr:ATP-dependent Clp protease ATP-binding subunit [Marseilla massiliensis]MBM6672621.1 ATP-dependent Clp protease ATP-binding subunit [Marseilla massiliensis]CCY64201.1 aTP-dependent Clp protease ATP-binding subunit ClpC [Prevotella sp. CAG:1124]
MTSQFSPKVSQILAFSREEAARLASRSVGPEHLLLGILRDKTGPVHELFVKSDINFQSIKDELEQKVREEDIAQPLRTHELVLNEKASNILKLAVLEARIQSRQMVDEQHLLLAILHDQVNNGAKEVLEFNNMNYEDALTYFQQAANIPNDGISMPDKDEDDEDGMLSINGDNSQKARQQGTTTSVHRPTGKTPVLDNFGTDLTKAASEGKLDPVVGREREIQRVTEILCRRKKNNPVLIGEPGVGKSAIVEGLAQLICAHRTSPVLFNKRIINLDMAAIVAGTKYRGQFEERIRALVKEIEQNPDVIIFIDEIHTLVGAGSTPGSMDAANMLKPALARGTIQCIGATTLDEYRNSIEKDGALERRFQKVMVEPTTADETVAILRNIKDRYEHHHHVEYSDDAILACVKLTDRYVTDRAFPDKAIDALDEVGARVHLQHAQMPPEISEKEKEISYVKEKKQAAVRNQNFELAASYRDKQVELENELKELQDKWTNNEIGSRDIITDKDVADVVSTITGVPVQRIAEAEGTRLKNMGEELKSAVIAQDKAIEKMVKAIQRNRVGLKEANHPIGAFMFLGPTGVGKTYLAKKLAECMFGSSDALIRIDMSEYSESFNTSRLVGAPPGYVGYEEGGQLTEKVRRHPYSIVLLDEIEKAHGNVFNMLLQVLDEGRLTDGNGRLIDFRNTVIIMTSNAGTRQLKEFGRGVGFTAGGSMGLSLNENDKEYARSIIQKSLSKQFSPEFLNRLDEIITFDQLDLNAIKKIIDLELNGLNKRVEELGYKLDITDKAKEFVAMKGYDVQFGARPLKRAIQNYIEDGVCELLLDGKLTAGDIIKIDKNPEKEELVFN